eukprot:scaffold399411_cov62-Attheya_sp.AAC.1
MGNVTSASTEESGPEPTPKQVTMVFKALKKEFEHSSAMWQVRDKEQLMMKLRTRFQKECPSAMGAPTIDSDIAASIGRTKLVRINRVGATHRHSNRAEVVAKLEFTNPGLSVKDRIAIAMLEDAEANGLVTPGLTTIVDVTSGNTGIAWGMVAAAKGYQTIQVIPESFSMERRALMLALGVEVVVTPAALGLGGALKKYQEILDILGDRGFAPRQFDNPANVQAHFTTTGPEIWEQCEGKIDAIVTGYGTGGSISGITSYLRKKNPNFIAIAVEPLDTSLLHGDDPKPHALQGLSPPFIPTNAKVELFDEVIRCSTKDALDTAKELAEMEGIAAGISAGANVWAACQVAERPEMEGKRIVTILPSAAERYLSTNLYADLMDQAKNLDIARVDDSVEVKDVMQRNLTSLQEDGTKFRPNFHIT